MSRRSDIAILCFAVSLQAQTPQTAVGFFDLGSKQFNSRQFTEARESFSRAIERNAAYSEAYRALGMADLELKDYQGAYHSWLKAVETNPKDEKSKYYLGRLFYEADLPKEAAAWLREALTLAPADFEAQTYLGLCAEALGFDATAEHLYRKAIDESKQQKKPFAWAFLSLGNYLKKHGSQDEALATLEEGYEQCPEPHELAVFGELLALHDQPRRAEQVLRQAIAIDPALSQPHYRLALLLKSLGRPEESRTEMAKFQEAKLIEEKAPSISALRK